MTAELDAETLLLAILEVATSDADGGAKREAVGSLVRWGERRGVFISPDVAEGVGAVTAADFATVNRQRVAEACVPNKSGKGHHDTETGHPCKPGGDKVSGKGSSRKATPTAGKPAKTSSPGANNKETLKPAKPTPAKPTAPPADRSKFVGAKVGKDEHVHSGNVEREVAGYVGGEWQEDNEPVDVLAGNHGFEVKSLLKGKKQGISVHEDALLRKVDWKAADPSRAFHTVVADERDRYGGGEFAANYSGHRLYYKRGSGRYVLSKMHRVKDAEELARLVTMGDDELPEAARGSLPSDPAEIARLRAAAEKAHASRLAKDRARKSRLKAERRAAAT